MAATNKKTKKGSKEKTEDSLHKIPLRITDTTLRDAHQSLWATRMRTEDIMQIIETIDSAGYYSLEVWGGATFDVCLRYLREDPWERLRLIKSKAKKTPLQMLLRGQNIVGYRNYADDVVDKFVSLACENGVDIFRCFDALNDTRNLASAVKAVKKYGGHAQGTLSYTISPVHTVEKYVQYAKEQVDLGIDSLCIKDMAGILTPIGAERLVSALVSEVGIPIQLHCHATSGMATATYVEAVRAGAGAIDCAISSMAGFSAQPPVESLDAIFSETNYSANLDMGALDTIAKFFADLAPKRGKMGGKMDSIIDPGILVHQIPGGMISNFRSQLAQQGALNKLNDALEEVTKVRKDLGYPPLVTPTSQIVGTQAVMNVLSGERYKIVPNEVKNYLKGMYGKSPAPVDPKFLKKILGDEKPIKGRPADLLEPELPKVTEGIDPKLIKSEEDIISYCILPEPALEYFKWRDLPPEERDPIPADLELEKQESDKDTAVKSSVKSKNVLAPSVSGKGISDGQMIHSEDYRGLSTLLSSISGMNIEELSVRKGDFSMTLRSGGGTTSAQSRPVEVPATETPETEVAEEIVEETAVSSTSADTNEYANTIDAPLVGTFYSSPGHGEPAFVKVGDTVKAGDKVCIVEAMKLFNEIEAPADGKILAILVSDGESVESGQALIAYDPA